MINTDIRELIVQVATTAERLQNHIDELLINQKSREADRKAMLAEIKENRENIAALDNKVAGLVATIKILGGLITALVLASTFFK